MTEEWKPVYGYEDCYAVSDRGNIVQNFIDQKACHADLAATEIENPPRWLQR